MIAKILFSIFGLASFLLGILILLKKGFIHHSHFIDLSNSYITVSLIIFFISILFFVIAFRSNKEDNWGIEEMYICASCIKPFSGSDLTDGKCPLCQKKVEALKGFYERHPELKRGT